ncbi:hypothetical protein [Schaalia sp. ZJ1691]|uniref:hypothetical protein n=1 Tax=Schaalia sp. ZJ1691 TaxID=2709404 RepID=UPI0013EDF10E|nr:hypothetical protein [Schaalia sp. ZJ1691]
MFTVARSKVQDEAEALRLLRDEGYTYPQMVEFYREKYGIETTVSLWSRFLKARNEGRSERVEFQASAVPWIVKRAPKRENLANGLRALALIDANSDVTTQQKRQAASVMRKSMSENVVVDYDAENNEFIWVPRRDGIDTGWIRDPFLDDDGNFVADLRHVRLAAFEERILSL